MMNRYEERSVMCAWEEGSRGEGIPGEKNLWKKGILFFIPILRMRNLRYRTIK